MYIPAWIFQFIVYIINTFDKFITFISTPFTLSSYYIFEKNNFLPQPFELYNLEMDEPYMLYDIKERVFIPWISSRSIDDILNTEKQISLPVLSLTINYAEEIIYDLTEFIENMRVFDINGVNPAVAHIISIWQIHSGVILDDGIYNVHYIDTMGNEHMTDIRCLKNLG
jgi:hypothetical protein